MVKVALGLSGGIDSAVSAYLLKQKGYDVTGVYFWAWDNRQAEADQKSAAEVAKYLGLRFIVLDIRRQYRQKVIDYFFNEYSWGRVPSPDVVCNREIKFGLFYNWAKKNGFDRIATGHYAKIKKVNRRLAIFRPKDKTKDQTYFLYQLKEKTLPDIIWPLADLAKKEVRQLANKIGLPNKNQPESMGICFLGPVNIEAFLASRIAKKEGDVILPTGKVIGKHKGVWFYALGQRHGFKINRPAQMEAKYLHSDKSLKPLYVIGKNMKENKLIVSTKDNCLIKKIILNSYQPVWPDESLENRKILVRVRNLADPVEAKLEKGKYNFTVRLNHPIFITSPGQPAVFYNPADRLLGGAIIKATEFTSPARKTRLVNKNQIMI